MLLACVGGEKWMRDGVGTAFHKGDLIIIYYNSPDTAVNGITFFVLGLFFINLKVSAIS